MSRPEDAGAGQSRVFEFDDLRVDLDEQRLFKAGQPVALEPKAFELLCFMMRHPGRLVGKQELLDAVWGGTSVTENAMTRVVAHLRRALGDQAREARYLETVPTRGYRFIARPAGGAAGTGTAGSGRRGWILAAVLAAAAALLAAPAWLRRGDGALRDRRPLRLAVDLEDVSAVLSVRQALDIASDGSAAVFVGLAAGAPDTQLFVRRLDDELVRPLPGTEGARLPFVSPDGEWVGFVTERGLSRVALAGGPPEPIASGSWSHVSGATWSAEADAVYLTHQGRLVRVAVGGDGGAELVAEPDPERGEVELSLPRSLPEGRGLLVTVRTGYGPDDSRVERVDPASGEREVVVPAGYAGRYSATGHVLFVWHGSLLALPFDLEGTAAAGPPRTVLDAVLADPAKSVAHFAASDQGTLLFLPQPASGVHWTLRWFDRRGESVPALDERLRFNNPAVAPDGRRFAFRDLSAQRRDVWVCDPDAGLFRLGVGGRAAALAWSPDGRRLAYGWTDDSVHDVWVKEVRQGAEPRRLTESPSREFPKSWSPDGERIAFEHETEWANRDVWVVAANGGPPEPLLASPADEREPAFSPDGRWIAYQSNASGRYEVYLADVADTSRRWPVSDRGGVDPLWTKGGRELVFRNGATLFAVAVAAGSEPGLGFPQPLFEEPLLHPGPGYRNHDVAPDGERFLIVGAEGVPNPSRIGVLLNWPAALAEPVAGY